MSRTAERIEVVYLPGRGLVTAGATAQRIGFLNDNGITTKELQVSGVDLKHIQNNIENYIGSVEIPVGVAGPLRYNSATGTEEVYIPAGTLEGALVASMNRGARAITYSGGFTACMKWQRMLRAPLFIFSTDAEAEVFLRFSQSLYERTQVLVSNWSNHAKLLSLEPIRTGSAVHLRFVYTTCDASGQNMTTTCTWHAMEWIAEEFYTVTAIRPLKCIIEGNGSSDKKVSSYARENGRGVHIRAQCYLKEEVIQRVLRTSSADIITCVGYAKQIARIDGMFTFNINVANAIAAIYVATGQDLGSLHESSNGIFNVEAAEEGLIISVELPNLVIGTVGGGTHVPKQAEALGMIGCAGAGKLERFASLIAGAVLGLEISTCSAIASGEFAKSHEKLGRNKPVDWLVRGDLSPEFFHSFLLPALQKQYTVCLQEQSQTDNGILTSIAARNSKKVIGFQSLLLVPAANQVGKGIAIIAKIKATDEEVIKGLHSVAASIDPRLSDLIRTYSNKLEYNCCHLKEVKVCRLLAEQGFTAAPKYYGSIINKKREIFILLQEYLQPDDMLIMNSENDPGVWTDELIQKAITTITEFHRLSFENKLVLDGPATDTILFKPWEANELYNKLIDLIVQEDISEDLILNWQTLKDAALCLQVSRPVVPLVLIHNDFNPRNVGVRKNGELAIYDWELVLHNYPQRDVIEFLCFAFDENYSKERALSLLHYQHGLWLKEVPDWEVWKRACVYALKEFLITRAAFYEIAGVAVKYEFSSRIIQNAFRLIEILTTC